jgi:hypothetical protein
MWKLTIVLIIILTGCKKAVTPSFHEFEKTWTVPSTFDQTWEATIELFAARGWPIEVLEKDSGIIASDWVRIHNQDGYADCGEAGWGIGVGRREVEFNIFVKRDMQEGPRLTVNCNFRELRIYSGYYSTNRSFTECNSTGKLEAEIYAQILDIIKQ